MVTSSPSTPDTQGHYAYLDGLRGILALWVAATHSVMAASKLGYLAIWPGFYVFSGGRFAVCWFIVLSGFCLTLPVEKNGHELVGGKRLFFRRRSWRILPPYFFAFAVCLILDATCLGRKTGTFWDLSLPLTVQDIAIHVVLIQNFFTKEVYRINPVFWSIAVEWQIYFLFPLLLYFRRRIGPVPTALIAVGLTLEMERRFIAEGLRPSASFIGLFALGMLAAQASYPSDDRSRRVSHLPWRIIASAALAVFTILDQLRPYSIHFRRDLAVISTDVAFGAFAAATLVLSSKRGGWLFRILSLRLLAFLGSFAYSIYLIHAPVLQLLWQYPFAPLQSYPNAMALALLTAGTVIVIVISYAFFWCFERPFLRNRPTILAGLGNDRNHPSLVTG